MDVKKTTVVLLAGLFLIVVSVFFILRFRNTLPISFLRTDMAKGSVVTTPSPSGSLGGFVKKYPVNAQYSSGVIMSPVNFDQIWVFGKMKSADRDISKGGGLITVSLEQGDLSLSFKQDTLLTSAKNTPDIKDAQYKVIQLEEIKTGDFLEITAQIENDELVATEIRRKLL